MSCEHNAERLLPRFERYPHSRKTPMHQGFYGSEPNMPAVFAYVQARFRLKATGCTVDENRCDVAARFGRGADSQVVSREGYEKLLASVNLIASMPSRLAQCIQNDTKLTQPDNHPMRGSEQTLV